MNRLHQAIAFANRAYGDQRRKGDGEPLVLHAMEAMEIASTITEDEDTLIATVLHDVVEDTGIPMDSIRDAFGSRVVQIVAADTEDKRPDMPASESWMLRKQDTIDLLHNTRDLAVKALILGDKLSNLRSFLRLKQAEGADMWRHFNQKDPEKHHWYYRSIRDALTCFAETDAFEEYEKLIHLIFEEEA